MAREAPGSDHPACGGCIPAGAADRARTLRYFPLPRRRRWRLRSLREAEEMLKELVEGGHLEVGVRGGGLSYSLWVYEGVEKRATGGLRADRTL